MELQNSSSTKKRNQTLPPRRGQVKIRIIKSLVRSVASMTSAAMEKRRKGGESGAALSSCSTTAAPTPIAYDSDQMDYQAEL
ncbi:hypothetical protein CCACVL1_20445 [Corchorus capsularis]|uniref:Uncharacterized protein n=1 Tax=Corchorus capsularis TaxID=210143 RepID=A0A1R3HB51_COCAP|nr:hypothetical protein CCACVL1_20445 [Corchorus capsularis]